MIRSAYTLIELLVVMGLIALLASFVVPTFQVILAQYELTTAANQVAAFLRLTEQRTVTEQQTYGVTLTAGASTIPQFQFNPSPSPNGTKTQQTPFSLPNNISVGAVNFSGNSDVLFTTSGAPSVSGNLVLHDAARNKNREVDIRPSGAVFDDQPEY